MLNGRPGTRTAPPARKAPSGPSARWPACNRKAPAGTSPTWRPVTWAGPPRGWNRPQG